MRRRGAAAVAVAAAIAAAACGGGSGGSADEPAPAAGSAHPQMAAAELQRSRDACKGFVDRACGCAQTVAAAKPACDSAHGLADAIKTTLEVVASPDSTADDVRRTERFIRNTVTQCIEQTAKLPALGCAP